MKSIVEFYQSVIMNSVCFKASIPVNDMELLYPEFRSKLQVCISKYKNIHPEQDIGFSETYRSNVFQDMQYTKGVTKTRKNSVHHYGVAADCIFIINGVKSYKGDIELLRHIYKNQGLYILNMWEPLHVQYIPVSDEQKFKNMVNAELKS